MWASACLLFQCKASQDSFKPHSDLRGLGVSFTPLKPCEWNSRSSFRPTKQSNFTKHGMQVSSATNATTSPDRNLLQEYSHSKYRSGALMPKTTPDKIA
jgi:hypothetical protein